MILTVLLSILEVRKFGLMGSEMLFKNKINFTKL